MEIPKTVGSRWVISLALGLILLGVGLRLVPHVPNFAPIGAIAFFGGAVLGWRTALGVTLSVLVASDLILGFYPGMEWTWLSFSLIAGLGVAVKVLPSVWRVPIGALGSSIVFFIVSNFGTWVASGMYSHDATGLIQCYVMALPFYKATLVSDLLFSSILFGVYAAAIAFSSKRTSMMTQTPRPIPPTALHSRST